jgi:hypothetical protein
MHHHQASAIETQLPSIPARDASKDQHRLIRSLAMQPDLASLNHLLVSLIGFVGTVAALACSLAFGFTRKETVKLIGIQSPPATPRRRPGT